MDIRSKGTCLAVKLLIFSIVFLYSLQAYSTTKRISSISIPRAVLSYDLLNEQLGKLFSPSVKQPTSFVSFLLFLLVFWLLALPYSEP